MTEKKVFKNYRALKKGFDGEMLREKGAIFAYAGKPGSWMELVDKSEAEGVVGDEDTFVPNEEPSEYAKGKKAIAKTK